MDLREALIRQGPSLELQRAAQAEIARLDAQVRDLTALHYKAQAKLASIHLEVVAALEFNNGLLDANRAPNEHAYDVLLAHIDHIHTTIHED
mgnify:CR=1 FL=1